MTKTVDKQLLFNVIDSLPPEELRVIYRMFSGFIEDYIDTHLSKEEYEEHLQVLEDVRSGEYTALSDLPD